MKIYMRLLLVCIIGHNNIFAYRLDIINETGYWYRLKIAVKYASGDVQWKYSGDLNAKHPEYEKAIWNKNDLEGFEGIVKGTYFEALMAPYAIVSITNVYNIVDKKYKSGFAWRYAHAYNRWGSEINLIKHKPRTSDIKVRIEPLPGGLYHVKSWVSNSKDSKHWDQYKDKHEGELRKKRLSYRARLAKITGNPYKSLSLYTPSEYQLNKALGPI